jgi:imidazolonepropionase
VQVAVDNNAWSADHLEYLGDEEIEAFARSLNSVDGETVPVALPGCSYFLGIPYANTRALISAGMPVALATDFNPGSSPVCSLQMVWALACTQQKMLPAEAFNAITCNAARALRLENQVGSIAPQMDANFITTSRINAVDTIPYFFGKNHVEDVFILGNRFGD